MLFLSNVTILHIFYRFGDHTTEKKKIVTQEVTNFSPMRSYENLKSHFSHKTNTFLCDEIVRKIKTSSNKN